MMLPDVCLCVCRVHIQVAFVENWQIIAVGHIRGILCREQRPRKTKIDTKVAHVTRDSQTTFKVKGQGHVRGGAYCGGLLLSLFVTLRFNLE